MVRFARRTSLLGASVAVTVAGTGMAWAYWTSTGSGTGTAATTYEVWRGTSPTTITTLVATTPTLGYSDNPSATGTFYYAVKATSGP